VPLTRPGQRHTTATTTPTGHTYHSTTPPLPGARLARTSPVSGTPPGPGTPSAPAQASPPAVHILGRVVQPRTHQGHKSARHRPQLREDAIP
jgi:hypothetical protein